MPENNQRTKKMANNEISCKEFRENVFNNIPEYNFQRPQIVICENICNCRKNLKLICN